MKFHQGLAFPDADEFMVSELGFDGSYQRDHLEKALEFVTSFGCAIDGGAHIGTWTLRLATRFANVVAFEPSVDTFECLQHNIAQAGLTNITAHHAAIGQRAGSIDMTLDKENAARKNTGARHIHIGRGPTPMITIDSLGLESVGFLKLDVEGSEPWALEGARKTIGRCKPVILFENKWLWTRHFGLPKDAVARLLKGYGYQPLAQISRDAIWGPK